MRLVWDWISWTWGGTPIHQGSSGYNIVSGPLADTAIVGAVLIFLRKHNCHVHRCWHMQWKEHNGHMLCKKHHPHDPPKANEI